LLTLSLIRNTSRNGDQTLTLSVKFGPCAFVYYANKTTFTGTEPSE